MCSTSGTWRGGYFATACGDGADMLRRRAAAAADDVDQPVARPFLEQPSHVLRRLVIFAHLVGQAGIGIDADQRVGHLRNLVDRGPKLLGAEGAIEADREWPQMLERIPEGLRRLAGEIAPRQIGDGVGQHDRQLDPHLVEHLLDGKARGLGVQRVEDGLDEDRVHAALDQAARLRRIGLDQRIEAHIAEAGIVHVGRERRRAVGRADGAGDEARLVRRLRGPGVGRVAGELRRGDIQLVGDRFEPIVGLRDRLRIEGVGLEDVGAGFEIGVVDLADDLGLASAPRDRCCP